MRAVIYARYSSDNQREASIQDQLEVAAATSSGRAGRSSRSAPTRP